MPRSSRADAARHHEQLIEAASRLFRERGVESVSVPEVMAEIGLTRGGFYKHFESKEALVAAAVEAAFDEHIARLVGFSEQNAGDGAATRAAFVEFCLSAAHRDDPARGCPSSLATAMAQAASDAAPRAAFTQGMWTLLDELAERAGGGETQTDDQRERILADLAMLVGAVVLARATANDPISDLILTAARNQLRS